ncbi:MAG TPA: hypothetical protein VFS96_04555 [Nitrolancea sp.]|nr:hypothetical protein [Nitrolancea sp.]
MISLLAGVVLLAAMGAPGVAVLRRAGFDLDPLERVSYGIPLGVVVSSLVLLGLAIFLGLSVPLIVVVGVASAVVAGLLWPGRPSPVALSIISRLPGQEPSIGNVASVLRVFRSVLPLLPALVIGGFVLRWVALWNGALTFGPDGLYAGQLNLWGDWAAHLGDVTSFAYSENFPPEYPRLAGQPFAYHYLASITAAAMVKLGMSPITVLPLQSFLFSVLLLFGLYAFARRLLLDRNAAALAVLLFLLGGGLGWLITAGEIAGTRDLLGTVLHHPWDVTLQADANYQWKNVFFSLIEPQRPYLYGLPLALLILTLLLVAVQTRTSQAFIAAGLVAGLLPLAHLGTLLALALVTPFLFLLFPSRRWFLFFGIWVAVAVPQLLLQQGGQPAAASAIRLQIGWVANADPWIWFWVKNLGLFLPLLLLALISRDLIPPVSKRFLLAFMPVFVIANLIVFQPWDWDNTKTLVYWFLAVCLLVAALLVRLWRRYRSPVIRGLLLIAVATMLLSGVLINLQQFLGLDRNLLLTTEELQVAEQVREKTPPRAVFVTGIQHNHPVSVLTGRRIVMGYPGWLWSYGFDYSTEYRDLRSIFAYEPDTPALLKKYGVDYVVIGPGEFQEFDVNVTAFSQRYPAVIRTDNYAVFDVRGS